ncbi:MAG: efflux RND transporter periplasmic adaptor subunit [Pseudomonadota bacterium]
MSSKISSRLPTTTRGRVGAALTVVTAAIAIVSGLVGVVQPAVGADPAAAGVPPATPVSVATVAARDINAWDEFSGRLEAVQRVDVRSRVAGAVLAIHFREGALVKTGDLLVSIDPAPYQAEVDRAAADVAAAEARLSYTRSEQARAQRLLDEKAIAQREFDERQNAGLEADARLRGARAALQTARLSLDYTQVRAPVAGRVGRIEITVGNLVAAGPGAPVLTTLVSVSPIYASFDTDEQIIVRALRDLPGGSSAREKIASIPVRMGTVGMDDAPYTGKLQLIDNQVDAKSGTVRVRAVFDNTDGSLIPGQFAKVRMGQAKSSSALLVSERAVGTDQNKKYVMVVGADDKAEYREVTLGAPVDGLRVVTSGLKAGERIVVNGLQRIRPGAQVAPQPVDMASLGMAPVRRGAAQS